MEALNKTLKEKRPMEDAKIDFNIPIVTNDASSLDHTIGQLQTIVGLLDDIQDRLQAIGSRR